MDCSSSWALPREETTMASPQNGKIGPLDGIRVLDWTIAQFGQ